MWFEDVYVMDICMWLIDGREKMLYINIVNRKKCWSQKSHNRYIYLNDTLSKPENIMYVFIILTLLQWLSYPKCNFHPHIILTIHITSNYCHQVYIFNVKVGIFPCYSWHIIYNLYRQIIYISVNICWCTHYIIASI